MTWIQTYSGGKFDYYDIDPDTILVSDIAHALANTCRFTGHSKYFYSVAQHSLHCMQRALPNKELALVALFHDAHEAYLGDVNTVLKHLIAGYLELENNIQAAIETKFGIPTDSKLKAQVKEIDIRVLLTERNKLIFNYGEWSYDNEFEPYPDDKITRYALARTNPNVAEHEFVSWYRFLTGQ